MLACGGQCPVQCQPTVTSPHLAWSGLALASAPEKLFFLRQQLEAEKRPTSTLDEPVSHWQPRLALNVMVDDFVFDGSSLPADVHRYMKM